MDDAISNTPSKFKAVTAYALFFQCTKAISSSVPILLPLIQQQFSLSPTTLQLMISVYLFVMVPFFPIANVLINRFGLKKLIILSSAGLIFACLIVAITPNFYFILVGRGLMGACVVVLELAVISLFRLSISTSRDGKLFFVSQTWVPSLGLLLGLIIAGVLGHFMAWQFVFYFVALITLLVVLYYFFTSKQEFYITRSQNMRDWWGLGFFILTLILLLVILLHGEEWGWGSLLMIGFYIAFGVSLIIFFTIETFYQYAMMPPKFILSLFTIRVFASCFIFQFFRWGVIFFTVLYMHNYLHYSTLFTAIGMLPLIAITLVIPFINLLLSKKQLNERFILVAYVILFLAALLYLLFLPVPPYYAIAILYVMIGIADAWGYTLTNVLAELSVTKNEFARLKSNMKLQHRLGGVFGLVVLTLISQSFVFHHFDHVILHNVVVSHAMRLKIMSYVGRNLSPSILHQHFSMISLQAWHYFNVLFLHSIRIIFYILAIMVFLYLIFLTCCVMYKQYQCRHASN